MPLKVPRAEVCRPEPQLGEPLLAGYTKFYTSIAPHPPAPSLGSWEGGSAAPAQGIITTGPLGPLQVPTAKRVLHGETSASSGGRKSV